MSSLHRMIERHEGRRNMVYDDATGLPIKKGDTLQGNPTIGIGRELSMTGLHDDEVDYLLDNDIKRCVADLDKHLPWWEELSEGRQKALIDMRFNLGMNGLLKFRKMLSALKRHDYMTAAAEALNSKWADQVKGRAQEVAEMIRYG